MQGLRDSARQLLEANGQMRTQRLSSKYVGVYEHNRFGDVCTPGRVHELFENIYSVYWSDEVVSVAYAAEMLPIGSDAHSASLAANQKLICDSSGLLPPHTSQVHMLVLHSWPSTHESAYDGKLDLEVMARHAQASPKPSTRAWNATS